MSEFFYVVIAVLALVAVSVTVIVGLSFVMAWACDIRGIKPDILNLAKAEKIIGQSRWPNLIWRRHQFGEDVAELRSGLIALFKGSAKLIAWLMGILLACLIIYLVWSWAASWPIPVAIIVGALIIAAAIAK